MSTTASVVVRAVVALCVLFPTLSPVPGAGAAEVIFVDAANGGVGLQDGRTWQTAWSTIAQGAHDSRWFGNPGSVLLIRPGVYREQIDLGGQGSGIPGAVNVVRAEGPGVVVDGQKIRNECFLIDGHASYIHIDGIVCRNARHRGFLLKQAASNLILSNNTVFNSNDSGIELSEGASNNAIMNNRVYSSGAHGITLEGDAGEPADDFSREPENNGNRINAGAYGNTPEASLSWTGQADGAAPAGTVIIDGNAPYTNTLNVGLTLSATDPSGVSEMCISNDPSCTSWQPYATSQAWTLTPGDGSKTVYVRFRDGVGNANVVPLVHADAVLVSIHGVVPDGSRPRRADDLDLVYDHEESGIARVGLLDLGGPGTDARRVTRIRGPGPAMV